MQASSKAVVVEFLRGRGFSSVLDAPSGGGWLQEALGAGKTVDGIDLYADSAPGYRRFWKFDLDDGLPDDCSDYDLACCCEGLEHVGNPLRLLRHFHRALRPGGTVIVTTPSVWYPQARLQFLLRGFFPSFPPLAGKIAPGTHMHIMPWSWAQLHLYLRLAGFVEAQILPEPLSRGKHLHEHLFAVPARLYCRSRLKKATSDEERQFWQTAATDAALLGRHLIVTARKP